MAKHLAARKAVKTRNAVQDVALHPFAGARWSEQQDSMAPKRASASSSTPTPESISVEIVMGTSGPGLTAMRSLLEWHDLQRSGVARSVYETAIEKTRNWIRSGHPSTKVCMYESAGK